MGKINAKHPLTSKTLWANLIGLVAMAVQSQTGYIVTPETQLTLLAVINIVLRFVTGGPVDWKTPINNQSGWASGILLPWLALLMSAAIALGGCAPPPVCGHPNGVVTVRPPTLQRLETKLRQRAAENRAAFEAEYGLAEWPTVVRTDGKGSSI